MIWETFGFPVLRRALWSLPGYFLKIFRRPEWLSSQLDVDWAGLGAVEVVLNSGDPRLSCALKLINRSPTRIVVDRIVFEFSVGGTSIQGANVHRRGLKSQETIKWWQTNLQLNELQHKALSGELQRGNGRLTQGAYMRLDVYCDSKIGSFVIHKDESIRGEDVKFH